MCLVQGNVNLFAKAYQYSSISVCHLVISVLKELIPLRSFSLSGTKFHILGPTFDVLSEPW